MQTALESSHISARSVRIKMWGDSCFLALIFLTIFITYVYVLYGLLTLAFLAEAVASTASMMIGLSFMMSGLSYYFNFLDNKIAYRKYFGLVGFWLVLLYVLLLVFINPQKYFYGFFDNWFTADFLLGSIAVGIFAFMMMISTNSAMQFMGVVNWRRALRLGYLAYALLIARAVIIEGDQWLVWFADPINLPSLRLVGSVFALLVLVLRGSVVIVNHLKNR